MSTMLTTSSGCKFCSIILNQKDKIMKDNKKCVVIEDIKPKSKHHYLVLSKQHISKPTDLTVGDIALLEEMEKTGREVLREQLKKRGDADTIEDQLRVGFHYPPMLRVHHLHMHIIYPTTEMGMISKNITFRTSKIFKNTTDVINQLREGAGLPDPLEGNPAKNDVHQKLPAHAIAN